MPVAFEAQTLYGMQLTTSSDRVIEEPTADDIERELRALREREDSAVILSRDDQSFVQVLGGRADVMIMEYHDGPPDRHYRADVPLSMVIQVFLAYRDRSDRWRNLVPWEPVDLSEPTVRLPSLVVFLVAVAVLGLSLAFLWWSNL